MKLSVLEDKVGSLCPSPDDCDFVQATKHTVKTPSNPIHIHPVEVSDHDYRKNIVYDVLEIVGILHHKMEIHYHDKIYRIEPVHTVQEALEKYIQSDALPFRGHQNCDLLMGAPR